MPRCQNARQDFWDRALVGRSTRHEGLPGARTPGVQEVGLDLESVGTFLGRLSDVAAVGRGRPLSLVIAEVSKSGSIAAEAVVPGLRE